MKALNTLIKLYRRQLDAGRREMVVLEEQRQQMEESLERLRSELAMEQKAAIASQEVRPFYSQYAETNRERQQKLAQAIAEIDTKIYTLAETIAELFGELKKYEIALENKQKRLAEEEIRLENIRLSDIALGSFARKEQEGEEG